MSQPETYAVVDVETTRRSPIGHDASAFHPDNKVVLWGYKRGDGDKPAIFRLEDQKIKFQFGSGGVGEEIKLLVGHNISFDIHHMQASSIIHPDFLRDTPLWDTQLAEYLLTAQRSTYATLDDLTKKYVGSEGVKDSAVTKLFAEGKGADEVPEDLLRPYLEGDLSNTERVFIAQFVEAQRMKMLPLIISQMAALKATIEMTHNGLCVDEKALLNGAATVQIEVWELERTIASFGGALVPDFSPHSPAQLSVALFGGEVKVESKECVGTYKNGKPKWKKVVKTACCPGLGIVPSEPKGKTGYYSTADKVLRNLLIGSSLSSEHKKFVEGVLNLREQSKQLSTYWGGLLKLRMPDGRIHPQFNHVVTRTGRLSSSAPNLQNITNGGVKKVFVSRWEADGWIVEVDFKQLEMIELALVSGDPQLMHDILSGVDMHDALYKAMHGCSLPPSKRKAFKRCSFALIYGAGAGGVAAQGGVTKEEAKKFIETFYSRYKGVKKYHDDLIAWAPTARVYKGLKDETGMPMGEAVWTSATKRRYWFREYATDWGTVGFSPTELKNYMVQGGATGDKVPLAVGKLAEVLRNHPTLHQSCLLINTVHDSVVLDVREPVLQEALSVVKECLEDTPKLYEETFGVSMNGLPLNVELSVGKNWLDQREVYFETGLWRYRDAS